MRIGIDIDETVARTQDALIKYALKWDKKYLQGKGFKNKDTYLLSDMFYWTSEDVENFFKYVKDKRLFEKIKVKSFANFFINELYNQGNIIIFVTRRNINGPGGEDITKNWLDKHRFKYHSIIFECFNKVHTCLDEEIDYLIDDDVDNINSLNGTNVKGILISNGKNDSANRRVYKDWKEIFEFLSNE